MVGDPPVEGVDAMSTFSLGFTAASLSVAAVCKPAEAALPGRKMRFLARRLNAAAAAGEADDVQSQLAGGLG